MKGQLLVRLGVFCSTIALCANCFWTGYVLCKVGPMSDRGIETLLHHLGVTGVCTGGLLFCCMFLFDDLLRRKPRVTQNTSAAQTGNAEGKSNSGDVARPPAHSP